MGPYDKPFSPQEYLMHYGVKGMKWGVRRYQNKDGTLTKAGKERYSQNQQDGVDSFLKSVGSKKVSELTGSVNEDLAIQAVTYVSAFAAVLAVKAVQNRMLRKGRMKELDMVGLPWGAHGMVCSFYLNLCKSDHREGGITFETAKAANFNTNVSQTPVGSVESPAI